MVQVEEKERIRNAYFLQGKSIRQIAEEMRHSRQTVRNALKDSTAVEYKRKAPPLEPVIGPVKEIVKQWLAEDTIRPKRQRHTAHRIYERLRDEHGFTGAESTIRR